jgi:hypothetical protein
MVEKVRALTLKLQNLLPTHHIGLSGSTKKDTGTIVTRVAKPHIYM